MMDRKTLVIGFGNPGRLDDGLGPALAEVVDKLKIEGVSVDSNYQLEIEDAAEIAQYDHVLLADASVNCAEPFEFYEVHPKREGPGFTSHSVKPEALLAMSEDLFGRRPETYILAIRGYEFNEFGERLSEQAQKNLEAAGTFVTGLLSDAGGDNFSLQDYVT